MGKNFRETLNEQLKDPEFKDIWDSNAVEREIVRMIINGREATGMTQKQLAELTGISQADISRYETGNGNPTVKTLNKIANAFGQRLTIGTVQIQTKVPAYQ